MYLITKKEINCIDINLSVLFDNNFYTTATVLIFVSDQLYFNLKFSCQGQLLNTKCRTCYLI